MTNKKKCPESHLYKYLTARGGYDMLVSKNLKYSSPYIFNDPFDFQLELFNPTQMAEDVQKLNLSVIDELRTGKPSIYKNLSIYKELYEKFKPYQEQIKKHAAPITLAKQNDTSNELAKIPERFRSSIASTFILSLSERNDHPLMWSHYSEGHEGIVVQIACNENSLSEVEKVHYEWEIPTVGILEMFDPQMKDILTKKIIVKGDFWSYEKEWRHLVLKEEFKGLSFIYLPFKKEDVTAVYLGCKMKEETKSSFTYLIRNHYPHAKLYHASKSSLTFSLKMDLIE